MRHLRPGPLLNQLLLLAVATDAFPLLRKLGGLGVLLLAIADSFLLPLPGSVDTLVIVLSAAHSGWWPYYGVLATAGSLVGGYLTFRVGRKGGKEALEKKVPRQKLDKVYKKFEKAGFGTVFVPALLPPPFPIVPFLLGAGAMKYPTHKFLIALAAGRAVRFIAFGILATIYGRQLVGFFSEYYLPVMIVLIGAALIASLGSLLFYLKQKKQHGGITEQKSAA
jgi:membrane protein DedA with SNARE-associated domain